MSGLHVVLMVVAVNAFVLGVAFFALYQFNKAVSRGGH